MTFTVDFRMGLTRAWLLVVLPSVVAGLWGIARQVTA